MGIFTPLGLNKNIFPRGKHPSFAGWRHLTWNPNEARSAETSGERRVRGKLDLLQLRYSAGLSILTLFSYVTQPACPYWLSSASGSEIFWHLSGARNKKRAILFRLFYFWRRKKPKFFASTHDAQLVLRNVLRWFAKNTLGIFSLFETWRFAPRFKKWKYSQSVNTYSTFLN